VAVAYTSILPDPWSVQVNGRLLFGLIIIKALFIKAVFTSSGVQSGLSCFINAVEPQTNGVAPEVPPNPNVYLPSGAVVNVLVPGAAISGLK